MNFKNIKVILFDQGNTLVMDPFQDIVEKIKNNVSKVIFKLSKIEFEPDLIKKNWEKSNNEINYPHISHFFQEEPIILDFLENLKIPVIYHGVIVPKILFLYRKEIKKTLLKNNDVDKLHNVLNYLISKGLRLGVFSNDRKIDLFANLEILGIDKYFEYIKSSEELGIEKPNNKIFEDIKSFFYPIKLNEMAYVGDDPEKDIAWAKLNGLMSIWLKLPKKYAVAKWRNYQFNFNNFNKPDFVINDLIQLKNIF